MAKKSKKTKATRSADKVNPEKTRIPESQKAEISFWKKHGLMASLLFLLGMGIYSSSINFEYVLDDSLVFTKHNDVRKGLDGIPDILKKESFAGYFGEQKELVVGARYRPLSLITFAAEFEFTQQQGLDEEGKSTLLPNPRVSHFINILLYGLTCLLLFRVLMQWMPTKEGDSPYFNLAFVAALLYTIHPIHTEVVANVKGRDEILAFLLALTVCYSIWKYFVKGKTIWLAASAGLMMLALLAKENSLTFVAIVPLIGYFFRKTPLDRLLIGGLVLLIVSIAYLKLRTDVIGYFLSGGKEITDIMNNPFYGLNVGERFATVFYTLGLYLKLLIFPHPLTHDYYPYHIPIMKFSNWQVLLALFMNFILGIAALWGLLTKKNSPGKKNVWAFGILFYFITLSIVSNIPFTVGTFMNERFVYISSLGFCIALSWLLVNWLPNKFNNTGKIVGQVLLALFVLGFMIKTFTRIPVWATPLSLNEAAIKVSPNSARANTFYGTAVFNQYRKEKDRVKKYEMLDVVEYHIDRALEINPSYYSAMTMKAGVVAEQHKRDRDLQKCLDGFYNVLIRKANISFVDTYMDYLIDREDAGPIVVWAIKTGNFFTQKSDFGNALRIYKLGLKANQSDAALRNAIGQMYLKAGQPNRASEYLQ